MKKIDRYIITGRLGRGGMSTVYKASAPVTGRTVALKILQPREEIFVDLVGEDRLKEIFLEEAKIMGEISHDHIAKILDCGERADNPYIVLEYFAHSIGSIIGEAYQVEKRSRILSVKKTYEYIRQSLLGLERLHFAGIIHRDIKPFNLMLTPDDRVKIIDFGLSRVRGEEKMAIPGMQVGSPYYAAPEQVKNPKETDERSDLFSLGVLAYRLLTGELLGVKKGKPTLPSVLNNDLNTEWDTFLEKCINPSPEKRFSTAQSMRLALEEVYIQWQKNSKSISIFSALDQATPTPESIKQRKTPLFCQYKQLRQELNLDALMRPVKYDQYHFEFIDKLVVHCLETKSLWQYEGSVFTLSWNKAHEYIDYLNEIKWHETNSWRLPTTQELFSLLRPPNLLRDLCFESHISPTIHWLWSCDNCTRKKGWIADVQESFFYPLDKDGAASVCAVSTIDHPR